MNAPQDTSLASRLGHALGDAYTIEGEIGRGGMGVVYRARDERLQRRVAIKVLPPELAFQDEIRQRFMREAQTAARLSHPNIVPIHGVDEGGGLVYFVMGLVDGESLGARIKRRGQLPAEEVRRIMKETADALSAAHAFSVVHRDIKPDNILLEGTRGRVMVTDFGIAKALSAAGSGATLTGAGVAIGTPAYMSPEQAAGEREIDGRSDVYSLGIVAYQMVTGELPFQAPTVAGILMKQITEPAPMVTLKRPDVPEDLALAISRCLEKDPENRWPTADALRRALETRTVTGYRPTGTSWRAGRTAGRPTTPRSATSERPLRPLAGSVPARRNDRALASRDRPPLRSSRDLDKDDKIRPPVDTGEPEIVQKTRAIFARWAAVSGGVMLINIATGIGEPWFLFVAGGMGIPLLRSYATLWQSGYSWRDVLSRPAAHDSAETKLTASGGKLPRLLPAPTAADYGQGLPQIQQLYRDRLAILGLMERLPASEKKLLPEVIQTADALFARATDLGKTLHAMDANLETGGFSRIEDRIAAIMREPDDEERARRIGLLERQKNQMTELRSRRDQVAANLESCILAMQNVRFDLLRLKSAGVGAVLGDLTNATQQARALSRDVDGAIAAASEIKEAMEP
ncbi:MAG TPA: protein kinase [Gemmatimonadales bacterium]|nr:protein kinase [Gemmatimonadales bacterium]